MVSQPWTEGYSAQIQHAARPRELQFVHDVETLCYIQHLEYILRHMLAGSPQQPHGLTHAAFMASLPDTRGGQVDEHPGII